MERSLIIKGYDNKDSIQSFLFDFIERIENKYIIKKGIGNPSYNEVAEYNKQVIGEFCLNKEYIQTDIMSWIKKPIAENITNAIIPLLLEVDSPIAIIKNLYVRTIITIKHKFIDLIENKGKLLYVGKPTKYEFFILSLLKDLEVSVVILDFNNSEMELIIKNRFKVIDGKFKEQLDIEKRSKVADGYFAPDNTIFKSCNEYVDYLEVINSHILDREKHQLELIGIPYNSQNFPQIISNFIRETKALSRKYVIFENGIPNPTYEESSSSKQDLDIKIFELIKKLKMPINAIALRRHIQSLSEKFGFSVDSQKQNYKKVMNIWVLRYLKKLFDNEKYSKKPIIIIWGKLSQKEEDFIDLISLFPIDIVHFSPNKENSFTNALKLGSKIEYEKSSKELLEIPKESFLQKANTVAYNAERELDVLLYGDSDGIYRPNQFKDIEPTTLKTTYDEIGILWNQQAKYRPSFKTVGNLAKVGTIFAKIDGIPTEGKDAYLSMIRELNTKETILYKELPFIGKNEDIQWIHFVRQSVYSKKVDFDKIRNSKFYRYNIYSLETQDLIIRKIKKLLELNWYNREVKNLTYKIIETLFMLPSNITQLIHSYDFTAQIPKIIIFNGDTQVCSLEDNIVIMFLKLVGFDVLTLAPTGYQILGGYINPKLYNHITIGEYDFGTTLDDLNKKSSKSGLFQTIIQKIGGNL